MNSSKLLIKIFIKDKFLLIVCILLFVIINIVQISHLHYFNTDVLASFSQLQFTLILAIFYSSLFMFISYEFCRRTKTMDYKDSDVVSGFSNLKIFFAQFLYLSTLNLIGTLVFMAYNVGVYFTLNAKHSEFLCHILFSMLINFFLTATLAIFMGLLLALVFKRIVTYIIIVSFVFLTSPMFEFLTELLYNTANINLYPIFNCFNIYTPSLLWFPNFLFGYSVLPYRIILLSIWIFAVLAILMYKLITKKFVKGIVTSVCVALCTVGVVVYLQPQSKNLLT